MSTLAWTYIFVGLSFSLYIFIAWSVRVADTKGFYVAGRGVPAPANGMATAADWMSAASFISMAGLSNWIIALVAAGGIAAALSTTSGLLLVISSSVAHDLYYRTLKPDATEKQRLLLGRTVIGLAVVVAGIFGIYPPAFVGQVVAFAFGFAAASFFPAIVLGIFNRRVGTVPAVSGMVAGITFTAFYIIATVFFGMERWTFGFVENGVSPEAMGSVGMLLNFAVTLALTRAFPPPSETVSAMIDRVREPEDAGPAVHLDSTSEY